MTFTSLLAAPAFANVGPVSTADEPSIKVSDMFPSFPDFDLEGAVPNELKGKPSTNVLSSAPTAFQVNISTTTRSRPATAGHGGHHRVDESFHFMPAAGVFNAVRHLAFTTQRICMGECGPIQLNSIENP